MQMQKHGVSSVVRQTSLAERRVLTASMHQQPEKHVALHDHIWVSLEQPWLPERSCHESNALRPICNQGEMQTGLI